jgi:hypothetical protein
MFGVSLCADRLFASLALIADLNRKQFFCRLLRGNPKYCGRADNKRKSGDLPDSWISRCDHLSTSILALDAGLVIYCPRTPVLNLLLPRFDDQAALVTFLRRGRGRAAPQAVNSAYSAIACLAGSRGMPAMQVLDIVAPR